MLRSLFVLYSLINIISGKTNQCSSINSQLNKHAIHLNDLDKHLPTLTLCQSSTDHSCCPQIHEVQFRNATTAELEQLFEFHSSPLHELLRAMASELNSTMERLIESSRHQTQLIFQHRLKSFSPSYRSAIDLFYKHLLAIISKKRLYNDDIKTTTEELFLSLLRTSVDLSVHKQPILPPYVSCLWRNQPFGNIPNTIAKEIEVQLRKLLQLNDLFKLSIALVQTTSVSVTIDQHCIDSYLQLSYCNLCSGRSELPCLTNCINVMASCLVNVSRIHDGWSSFLDAIENAAYFSGIERALSSIGMSISDGLITFLNFDGIRTKDIIDQCGHHHHHQRQERFLNDQSFHDQRNYSSSILDQQLMSIRQSFQIYRSFWLMLPKSICQSNEISVTNQTACWTGSAISLDGRQSIRSQYDKPLNLRLQRVLKELKELSELMTNSQRVTTVMNISTTTIDALRSNLTDDLDDYPSNSEFDYSDYVYEDSLDDFSSTTTTTTTTPSTTIRSPAYDDLFIDDVNTVSYYDYGEQDVYTDDEIDEESTRRSVSISTPTPATTTVVAQIPSHHQRQPIIWNIHIDEHFKQTYNSSVSSTYSIGIFLLFPLISLLV